MEMSMMLIPPISTYRNAEWGWLLPACGLAGIRFAFFAAQVVPKAVLSISSSF